MNYTNLLRITELLGAVVKEELEDTIHHGECRHWLNEVWLKGSLPKDKKLHVLMHEICHLTGTKCRLNRESLIRYDCNEVYALVEETICEVTTVSLLARSGVSVDKAPLKDLLRQCDEDGIEWDWDIFPEVERITKFLTKVLDDNSDTC